MVEACSRNRTFPPFSSSPRKTKIQVPIKNKNKHQIFNILYNNN